MTPVLELRDVSLRIAGRRIVDGVSLQLPAGRMTVIIGPNGAGKSSLVGLASGFVAADGGEVLYDGRRLESWPVWRLAAKRAVMAQASGTGFAFTVRDVVEIGLESVGKAHAPALRASILAEALERADVAHLEGRVFSTLSGGEQQRTRFARALAQLAAGRSSETRQLLILDEPVSSLDLKHQIFLLESVQAIVRTGETGALLVLHDLALARHFADEIVILKDGRKMAAGPPGMLLNADEIERSFGLARQWSERLLPFARSATA